MRSIPLFQPIRAAAASGFIAILLTGCASPGYFESHPPTAFTEPASMPGPAAGVMVHRLTADEEGDPGEPAVTSTALADEPLAMFVGRGEAAGMRVGWAELMEAATWADVLILGEQHNDAVGHALQHAVVATAIDSRGDAVTLALEMLERDEQPFADDYMDGIIDAEEFTRRTESGNWGGRNAWPHWYLPAIDTIKAADERVIAANAPRRYVRLARNGYDELRALDADRRRLFELPTPASEAYRKRFFDVMSGMAGHGGEMSQEDANAMVESIFRSQQVWDATMADSVVRAHRQRGGLVILLIGQFHSDFRGGVVEQMLARDRSLRIVNVSMQPRSSDVLLDEDRGRADFVIHTGVIESQGGR